MNASPPPADRNTAVLLGIVLSATYMTLYLTFREVIPDQALDPVVHEKNLTNIFIYTSPCTGFCFCTTVAQLH